MAPQKRYGRRPRTEPIFRLSPFLVSSPVKAPKVSVDELADQLKTVELQEKRQSTPTRRSRAVLAPKSTNEQSPAHEASRTKKPRPQPGAEQLTHHPAGSAIGASITQQQPLTSSLSDEKSNQIISINETYTLPLLVLGNEPQRRPGSFSTWSTSIEQYFEIVKIAEASYGEVYRLVLRDSECNEGFHSSEESVLKVLALKSCAGAIGSTSKKSKAQVAKEAGMSAVDNVAAEVKLLQRMVDVPGFTNFRDVHVLQGKPSKAFAQAWKQFNDAQSEENKSQFPDPNKRSSYSKDQLWAVIEMQDAGRDLEHVKLTNVFAAWDVFWGVALALAKGEHEAEFEHRDLHMGNICVKTIGHNAGCAVEDTRLSNLERKLGYTGLETTIIDYTLSRADKDGHVEFLDLENEDTIFEGDAEQDYQYEMYRSMRSAMYFDNVSIAYSRSEAVRTGRTWADFHPQTNVVWLHFILHEMLSSQVFSWPSQHMEAILQHAETEDLVQAQKRAKELEVALKKLEQMLLKDDLPSSDLRSASDLVHVALNLCWLEEGDVVGEGDTTLSSLLA